MTATSTNGVKKKNVLSCGSQALVIYDVLLLHIIACSHATQLPFAYASLLTAALSIASYQQLTFVF